MIKLNKQAEAKQQLMLQLQTEADLLSTQLQYIRKKNVQLLHQEQIKDQTLETQIQKHRVLKNTVQILQNQHKIVKEQNQITILKDAELTQKVTSLKQTYQRIINEKEHLNNEIKVNQQRLVQIIRIVQNTAEKYEKAEQQVIIVTNKIDEKKAIVQNLQKKINLVQKDILVASQRIKPYS